MKRSQFIAIVLLSIGFIFFGCDKSDSNDPNKVTATFGADKVSGDSPLIVKFTNASANAVSYLWNFGDGTTSKEKDPTHTFSNTSATEAKTYTVLLTSKGADSTTASSSTTITVNKLATGALTASFIVDKETGESPLVVQFTNTSTGAVSYQWNFGDGTSTTLKDPSHTFINFSTTRDTTYMVSLIARDASFNIANANKMITVKKATTGNYPPPEFNPNLTYGEITDQEGNTYKTISIGTKAGVWMAENLRATTFNDGTQIPNQTDNYTWSHLTTPAFGWINNNAAQFKRGALYNGYVVDPAANGNKNVCPVGWHIATDKDWMALINFLGGLDVAGGKMKETGTTHWYPPNVGATNESGFTGLNSGTRSQNTGQCFENMGVFWGGTMANPQSPWSYGLNYTDPTVIRIGGAMREGLSIRCVKD